MIPRNTYKLNIVEAERAESKNTGRAMAKLKFEIKDCSKDDLNGRKLTHVCMLDSDGLEYSNNINSLLSAIITADLDTVSADNLDDFPVEQLVGQDLYALVNEKEVPKLDDNKEPIVNPNTGKPMMDSQAGIELFCPKG